MVEGKPIAFKASEIRLMLRQMKILARRQENAGRAPMASDVKYTRTAIHKLERLQEMTE